MVIIYIFQFDLVNIRYGNQDIHLQQKLIQSNLIQSKPTQTKAS